MTSKAKAAPSGNSAAAQENNVVALKFYKAEGSPKTGRSRYVRLFPERAYFLLARLTDREFVAYLRLVNDYVVRDGEVPADDKALARVAGMSARAWSELRGKLIELGLARIDGDRWVDPDQAASLEIQRQTSERQRGNALRRWRKR